MTTIEAGTAKYWERKGRPAPPVFKPLEAPAGETPAQRAARQLTNGRSAYEARRAALFRVYREAGIMQGLLNAAIIHEHLQRPEWTEALTAMEKVLPLAQNLSVGELHRAGTPEAQELLDAVMRSVSEWDAEMRREDDEDEFEDA